MTPLRTLSLHGTPFYVSRKMTPATCIQLSTETGLVLMGLDNGSFQMFDTMAKDLGRNRQNNTNMSYEHDAAVTSASFHTDQQGDQQGNSNIQDFFSMFHRSIECFRCQPSVLLIYLIFDF